MENRVLGTGKLLTDSDKDALFNNTYSADDLKRTIIELNKQLTEAREEIEKLKNQLPATMQECTILFKRCEKGHGRLTATNWIDPECKQCEIERLKEERADLARRVLERVNRREVGRYDVLGYDLVHELEQLAKGE